MKKPGEEISKIVNGIGDVRLLPAKQFMAGWNHMTGMLRRHANRNGIEAAEAYAREVLNSVNPEAGLYQRGRHERAAEFVKTLTETREAKANVQQVNVAMPQGLPKDNEEELFEVEK